MKLNIKKFDAGGFLQYQSSPNMAFAKANTSDSSAASKSSSKDKGLLSDSIMNQLQQIGMPNDVQNFMIKLGKFEDSLSTGFGSTMSKQQLYSLQAEANRIIQQANYMKKAEEFATKNEAIGEIAIGSNNSLFVQDDNGGIKQVSFKDYDAEKNGPALTVNDLIMYRKFSPDLVGDVQLTQAIGSNIGMQKINEYIKNILNVVGKSETSSEAYTNLGSILGSDAKRPNEQELAAIQGIAENFQQLGPDAIFKIKQTMGSKNVQQAMSYIMNSLPQDMKKQLIGRAVANGYSLEEAIHSPEELITNAILANNDVKQTFGIDFDSSANKGAGTKSGSNSEQKKNLKTIEGLVQGSLGKIDYHLTSSKNPAVQMDLHGNMVGALTNYDNNIVSKGPMSLAIESSIGPLIDKQHMMLGDQKINESMLDTILYDGNEVINVWAPVDANGDIDFGAYQYFNEMLSAFDKDPSLSIGEKNNILQSQGIDGYIDENNQFHGGGRMGQFLVFTGISSHKIVNDNNIFADKLNSEDKKFELKQIERIYGALNDKKANKHGALEFEKGWFNGTTDLYRAPIFMKLKPTAQNDVETLASHGPIINPMSYSDMVTRDQMRYDRDNQTQQIYTPSSQLLYQE